MQALHSLLGFFALHGVAWALGENRRAVAWRPVVGGMALTLALGVVLLKIPAVRQVFFGLNRALDVLERATRDGTAFVFGYLGGAPLPFAETHAGSTFVLAFRALPLVVVVSATTSGSARNARMKVDPACVSANGSGAPPR